jgi:RNA polymerase sigma-70 factor (ECF subfamily)
MEPTATTIWEQFNGSLKALICQKLDHDDCCEDILQDLYLKIFINIGKVRSADNIRAYVFQMAHNAVTDHYRKRNRALATGSDDLMLSQADVKEEKNEYQLADCCLRPMIEALPDIYRDALILTELEGNTQQQLANRLGISLSAAKSRVQRAREKLKEEILKCCQYEFDRYGNIISCCGN